MADEIYENEAGERVRVVGGKLIPVTQESPGSNAFFGTMSGVGRAGTNVAERLGFLDQSNERDRDFRARIATNPVSTSVGQGLGAAAMAVPGAIAGNAAATALALGRVSTFALTSLGSGVGVTLTEEAGVEPGESLAASLGVDAATAAITGFVSGLPGIAGKVVNNIVKGSRFRRDVLDGDMPGSDLVTRLQDEFDVPLTPGQASGKRSDLTLEGSLQASPFRSGFEEIGNEQQRIANRTASRSIGLDTDFIDNPALTRATKDIGARIESITDAVGDMSINQGTVDQLRAAGNTRFIKGGSKSEVNRIADDLQEILDEGGVMTPADYRGLREAVGTELGSADGQTATALGNVLDVVDGIPEQALIDAGQDPAIFSQAYGEAREQWRNLIALKRPSSITGDGDVRIRSLDNNMRSIYGDKALDPNNLTTPGTADLLNLGEGFSSGRMAPRRTSQTAENLAVDNAVDVLGTGVGTVLAGGVDPAAIAPGATKGIANALLNPLHLAAPLEDSTERILRAFGAGAASAALPEDI